MQLARVKGTVVSTNKAETLLGMKLLLVKPIDIETWEEKGGCFVSVIDDGAGIDEKDLPHVFDRFYTVDKAHTSGKGTGLGLSIVRQILLQHGRDITVQSASGKGTNFTFSLDPAPSADIAAAPKKK